MAAVAAARAAKDAKDRHKKDAEFDAAELQKMVDRNEKFHSQEDRTKWLETHDLDNSGAFEQEEFEKLLRDLAPTLLTSADQASLFVPPEIIAKIFKDKTSLNVDETYAGLKRCLAYIKSQTKLHELFRSVDANEDGYLNKKELANLLAKAAPKTYKVSQADVDFILIKCDTDRDGNISIPELSGTVATWMEVVKGLPAQATEKKKSSACAIL